MSKQENGRDHEVKKSNVIELRATLQQHVFSDDPLHQGNYQGTVRKDCSPCMHLTRMIELAETKPVIYYAPPHRPMPRVTRIK